jgi:hypothetical protein
MTSQDFEKTSMHYEINSRQGESDHERRKLSSFGLYVIFIFTGRLDSFILHLIK